MRQSYIFNSSTNNSSVENSPFTRLASKNSPEFEFDMVKAVLSILVIFSTIVGNLVITLSFVQNFKMRTVTNTMVLNNCIADTFLAISDVAFYLVPAYIPSMMDSDVLCTFSAFFDSLFKIACVLSMVGIALDRYLHLVRLPRKRLNRKQAKMAILWCWLQSMVAATPWEKLARSEDTDGARRHLCKSLPRLFEPGPSTSILPGFLKVACILLPLLIVYYMSVRIFRAIRRRRKVEIEHPRVVNLTSGERFVVHAYARSSVIAITLFGIYIACTAPFASAIILSLFPLKREMSAAESFVVYFSFRMKGSLFPLLFILRNAAVLASLKNIFGCKYRRKTTLRLQAFVIPDQNLHPGRRALPG